MGVKSARELATAAAPGALNRSLRKMVTEKASHILEVNYKRGIPIRTQDLQVDRASTDRRAGSAFVAECGKHMS